MKFFSGFSFKNDEQFFKKYLNRSEFTVAGFSFGAILAFEYALKTEKRIDTLQLFSPAFFQDNSEKFLRTQLFYFKKDKNQYIDNFIKNSFFPSPVLDTFEKEDGTLDDLEKLLTFQWKAEDLQKLKERGTKIQVFLGGKDKIINSQEAFNFFENFAEICFLKSSGHILL